MASPHVAGVAALYLQGAPTASPATVASAINVERDDRQGHEPRHGLAEPAAVLAVRRAAAAPATAAAATSAPARLRPRAELLRLAERHGRVGDPARTARRTRRRPPARTAAACAGRRAPTSTCTSTSARRRARWSSVAQSISTSSTEDIAYSGTAGTYRWRIVSYSGSGAYTFGMTKPAEAWRPRSAAPGLDSPACRRQTASGG